MVAAARLSVRMSVSAKDAKQRRDTPKKTAGFMPAPAIEIFSSTGTRW
jgi:hypothetical protein